MKQSSKPKLKLIIQSPLHKQESKFDLSHLSTTHQNNNQLLENTTQIQSPLKKIQSFLQKSNQSYIQYPQSQHVEPILNIKNKLQKDQHLRTQYQNHFYKRALQYSRSRKLQNDFNKQFKIRKKSSSAQKSHSLNQFIKQKQAQLLTQKNVRDRNQIMTEQFLKDNAIRDMALQKAILLERFYYLDKNKKKAQMNNEIYLPKRFKGLNPKHMRLKTHAYNYESYKRQMYVQTKATFQYFQKALKAENQLINNKIKQNSDLINLIVDLNSKNTEASIEYSKQTILIKRLFLKYCNMNSQDPQQLYKFISFDNLIQICTDFQITIQYSKMQKMYEKFKPITIHKFYEILNILSQLIYGENNNLISNIINKKFMPMKQRFIHQIWIQLQQYLSNDKNFLDPSKKLYKKLYNNFEKQTLKYDKSNRLNYVNCFQFIWRFNIFPKYITKSKIRYFYEYSGVELQGLKVEQFIEFIFGIGLYINKEQNKSTEEKIKNFIVNYNYFDE